MPLLITANDKTIVYGSKISGIDYTYAIDNTNVPLSEQADLLDFIKRSHRAAIVDSVIGQNTSKVEVKIIDD